MSDDPTSGIKPYQTEKGDNESVSPDSPPGDQEVSTPDEPDGLFSKLKCLGGKAAKKEKKESYRAAPSNGPAPTIKVPTKSNTSLDDSVATAASSGMSDNSTPNSGIMQNQQSVSNNGIMQSQPSDTNGEMMENQPSNTNSGVIYTRPPVYTETVTASLGSEMDTTTSVNTGIHVPRYNFNHSYRGLAIVIAEEKYRIKESNREGAKLDGLRMERIFKKWGFLVKTYPNLNKSVLMSILKWASVDKVFDHSLNDAFAFAMLSHGGQRKTEDPNRPNVTIIEDYVETSDHRKILISDIVDLFKDSNCPSLKGKPRLFFFQSCRGKKSNKGVDVWVKKDEVKPDVQMQMQQQTVPVNEVDLYRTDYEDSLKQVGFDIEKWIDGKQKQKIPDTPDANFELASNNSQMGATAANSSGDANSSVLNPQINSFVPPQKIFEDDEEPYNVRPVPGYKDFMILYASPPGVFAFKKGISGTPFAIHLYKQLYSNFNPNLSLSKMITRACERMALEFRTVNSSNNDYDGIKQVMCFTSQLTKDIYFYPKETVTTV